MTTGLSSATSGIQKGLTMTLGRTITSVVDTGKEKVAAIIE